MTIKDGMIGFVVCCSLAAGMLLERYGTQRYEYIDTLENHIQWQDSLINQLRADKDSLRITRAEFESAVKLLESKK